MSAERSLYTQGACYARSSRNTGGWESGVNSGVTPEAVNQGLIRMKQEG
jgi:hypothetical protein